MSPDRVYRLIIDGVVNLDTWYNSSFFKEAFIDTDRIFVAFVAECLQVKENFPLNLIKSPPFKNAGELQSYIHDFLQELEREPIPVSLDNSNHGAVTRDGIVANGIFLTLYSPVTTWQSLADNIAELLKGNATLPFEAYFNSRISSIAPDETNTVVTMNDNWKTGSAAPVHGIQAIQNYSSLPLQSTLMSKYEIQFCLIGRRGDSNHSRCPSQM